MLNKFLLSIYQGKISHYFKFPECEFTICLDNIAFDADIVRDKFMNLEPHKAAGSIIIFKKSLDEGKFPTDRKL